MWLQAPRPERARALGAQAQRLEWEPSGALGLLRGCLAEAQQRQARPGRLRAWLCQGQRRGFQPWWVPAWPRAPRRQARPLELLPQPGPPCHLALMPRLGLFVLLGLQLRALLGWMRLAHLESLRWARWW